MTCRGLPCFFLQALQLVQKGYLYVSPVVFLTILHQDENAFQQVVRQVAPLRVQVQPLQSFHYAHFIACDGGEDWRDFQLLPAEYGCKG